MKSSNQVSQTNAKTNLEESKPRLEKQLNRNTTQDIHGNAEELWTNVHCHGRGNQAEFFNGAAECAVDCMGWVHNKDMRQFVMNDMELKIEEPKDPQDDASKFKSERQKMIELIP